MGRGGGDEWRGSAMETVEEVGRSEMMVRLRGGGGNGGRGGGGGGGGGGGLLFIGM
ncbi:UNVERIFIED_CONTAM: hypothetical protein Slati_3248700 [Sesamum latifolium]|uniref:Uncharacterized protein n=1 Tax=Sesamum latifolium TaxID=2727402 RepID=A0AAW2UZA4_9LAMI